MSYVTVTRLPNGAYRVSRDFANLPATMRATDALLTVTEAAYEPAVALPTGIVPHEAATVLQAALERAEADDLDPHDGRQCLPRIDEE